MFPIHEFVDEGLGHSSYLIDLGDGTAAVIDPPRFPPAHEEVAKREGLRIVWAADTHSHADYVTGSPSLVARLGTTFIAPAASNLATSHQPAIDGDPIQLGNDHVLMPLATPGHTPDHHAYVLEHNGDPIGLFTGGSLMVGTVGRTDLDGPEAIEPLAHEMFRSLRRFDDMPDDLAVYPTHGAGSFCGASTASERTTTLGAERTSNPLFAIGAEDEFVEALLDGFGSIPSHFLRLPELNRLGPSFYSEPPPLERLTATQVADHVADGAQIVDVRPVTHFGAGHIPGSMSNTLRPVFASWIGWLTEPGQPLVFVLDEDQDRNDLVRQCLDVGVENLLGELNGGIHAWVESGRPIGQIPIVDIDAAAPTVIDVRQNNEYADGHVPGAINVELGSVAATPPNPGPVTLMCGHGERAMTAASILTAKGQTAVSVFDGGPDTWAAATGLELQAGP